ncbi:pirin-like C-terminal cupin domain-containing protein, partial [Kitasatospora sp. NPDC059463]|uniref:pirin-like C-terminal cupin domain-containing protein n=1 Tax=Kitasatospora sp. NPDC059463 TaxID=3346842 RepID=UPI0036BED304
LVGADLTLTAGTTLDLPLNPDFEYAVLTMSGALTVDSVPLIPGAMLYLGTDRPHLPLHAPTDATFLLLGGEPFPEKLVMWWNFIARTGDEILQARADWETGTRFGQVHGYAGPRLHAPALPDIPLKARGRER